MSEDPLRLSGLDATVIEEAVSKRSKKPESEEARMRAETNASREARLAGGKKSSAPPTKTEAPPPPPEPVKDRSALLDKCGQYRERFPDLKSRNKISGKSSIEEIEDEIHFYQQQLGTKDGNMASSVLVAAMAGAEQITAHYWNPLGLQLSGLAKVTKDNQDEFQPILDELMIKYGTSMYVSPEMRLCGLVATLMYTVHSANTGDPRTAAAFEKMRQVVKPTPTDL